jgi:hypothetical protein
VSKGKTNRAKREPTEWKKAFANHTSELGINIHNIQGAPILKKNSSHLILKMRKR